MFFQKYKTVFVAASVFVAAGFSSCDKLIQTTPVGSINTDKAYANESNIEASVNGIYYTMQQTSLFYSGTYATTYALLSDEAKAGSTSSTNNLQFANNEISQANSSAAALWNNAYQVIYQCNSLIENVTPKTNLDATKKSQFLGEAKFLRAYCYFMLVNYYGAVPLATGTDYAVNTSLSRTPADSVNRFITAELEEAELMLPDGFSVYSGARTRATKQAAEALDARQYLYMKNWQKAIDKSSLLIADANLSLPDNYDDMLESNSPESIFELWFSGTDYAAGDFTASSLVPNTAYPNPAIPGYLPSDKLINAFEPNDKRKNAFIKYQATPTPYNYIYKYRDIINNTDQPKLFRLAEQYLIRTEARAELGLSGADADINVIRTRAGLPNTAASTKDELLDAVAQERFVELCFEGHRWPDLIRTGKIDAVMVVYKPTTWQSTDKLLPVPASEIGKNQNLNPQNPGYTN